MSVRPLGTKVVVAFAIVLLAIRLTGNCQLPFYGYADILSTSIWMISLFTSILTWALLVFSRSLAKRPIYEFSIGNHQFFC